MVEWKRMLETIWLLLTLVICIGAFSLYTIIGVINASILTLVAAFVLVIIGYFFFEKVMD
jgi:hypothetical protein